MGRHWIPRIGYVLAQFGDPIRDPCPSGLQEGAGSCSPFDVLFCL